MDVNTTRLEASSRIQERPFGKFAEERRRGEQRRHKENSPPAEDELGGGEEEEPQNHQLNDLA